MRIRSFTLPLGRRPLGRLSTVIVAQALLSSVASAQIIFYFSDKGGTNAPLVSDIVTSATWVREYDIIAENTGSTPVSFNQGNLLVAYAQATSQTVGAAPLAGTDKITVFAPGNTAIVSANPNITNRAPWFLGGALTPCSYRGGSGVANGVVRPYGIGIPIDMGLGSSQTITPGGAVYICTIKVKDNGCYGNAPYHDLFLYSASTGQVGGQTALLDGSTLYKDGNWQVNSKLRVMCGLMLPPSVWRVATVGDSAPGIGQTITALHPPVSSHDGKFNFVMRVTGSNTWATWRNGNSWQPVCGPGPYDTKAAINGLGRVATTRVAGLSDFVTTDWNNWCLGAGGTGSPPPLDTITGFEQPLLPSHLPSTVAFLASFGFNQGVALINSGTNLPTPYFMGRFVAPVGIVSLVQEYDLSDSAHRGLFHSVLLGGQRAMISDDAVPGGEVALATQGGSTGIGASTWTSFWSPAINTLGDTAFCAASNGSVGQDRFIVINGTIAIQEGDIIDGVSLAGFEPIGLDISNDGYMIHTWQSAARKVTFVGGLYAPLNSRVLLDTAGFINLECTATTLANIKGRPTIGGNLDLAVLCTLTGGTDVIVRSTLNCLADFNGDCSIDIADFAMFSAAYGSVQGGSGWESLYDLNTDGAIDIADFAIFSSVYGTNVP
ncbi:MAG: hypothetical protein K1X67_03020 [Fimbriimonadaceae bacterium]|nr:hypothetical protein [Fimbriimonadaceae bacterium]